MILKFGSNKKGQSTVEYILLLTVVATVVMSVFKSKLFMENFGKDGKILVQYKKQFEFAYRNGFPYDGKDYDYDNLHPSYSVGAGESHFFVPQEAYPEN
ncbi:MAG: hypothetical protein ACOYL6_05245 [Bacteriovoracaceae bacterium]